MRSISSFVTSGPARLKICAHSSWQQRKRVEARVRGNVVVFSQFVFQVGTTFFVCAGTLAGNHLAKKKKSVSQILFSCVSLC